MVKEVSEMRIAFTKDGEKTDVWWDAYEEGYENALRDLARRKKNE